MFINADSIRLTWQNLERLVCRLLLYRGFQSPRIVNATNDKGADIIAHKNGKRWLFQVKHWKKPVGQADVMKTVGALPFYQAEIPVVVSTGGFDSGARACRQELQANNVLCQFWDADFLIKRGEGITALDYLPDANSQHQVREYQETAIDRLIEQYNSGSTRKGMLVMATGLGKTRTICEFIRRVCANQNIRLLAIAHTNDLVYQLERAFLPFMRANQQSIVWNGLERQNPESVERADFVFACLNTIANYVKSDGNLPENFDIVFVDECHHVGDEGMYASVLKEMLAGTANGPFLVGVTATPWRPDESNLEEIFGRPLLSMDLVAGLRAGFLCNIDYRMYTTNLDWSKIKKARTSGRDVEISPDTVNKKIFISEWDDGVIDELQNAWAEQPCPRAIVFCGTITHAKMMKEKINARGFCYAEAVHSQGGKGEKLAIHERNRIIADFQIGKVQVMCCVDIFNEGVDVPDVNIVVFQRVTHSRRIFIQQLGRGLRLAEGKEKVIVLDFVSDVRRFAAGLHLKDAMQEDHVKLHHKIDFYRYGGKDERAESFLREWLKDISDVETHASEEDAEYLRYPPAEPQP